MRRLVGGGVAARWLPVAARWLTVAAQRPAVLDGGAAAKKLFFLLFSYLFSSTPSSGPISHLKVLKYKPYTPRSTKERKQKIKMLPLCVVWIRF